MRFRLFIKLKHKLLSDLNKKPNTIAHKRAVRLGHSTCTLDTADFKEVSIISQNI